MSAGNAKTDLRASNEVFIGKKPLMTYVTATLVTISERTYSDHKSERKKHNKGS